MNAVDTFHQRLREEIATVEKEIQSHNQQAEALTQRLEGLKRADELFDSDQAAIAELLHVGTTDGSTTTQEMSAAPTATMQRAAARPKATDVNKPSGRSIRITQGKTGRARTATRSGGHNGLTRLDMIAAVLRRHPRRTVRELMALLDKEFRWKTIESAVTAQLYTRRDKFVHTPPDRSTNRPVTWSLR